MNCCHGVLLLNSITRSARRRSGLAVSTSKPPVPAAPNDFPLASIQTLIDGGGQIMIGTVTPIREAAVAHDGQKTLVMLRRRPSEAIPDLLLRLDAAIATANTTGTRVDEINKSSSNRRYELQKTPSPAKTACRSRLRITGNVKGRLGIGISSRVQSRLRVTL